MKETHRASYGEGMQHSQALSRCCSSQILMCSPTGKLSEHHHFFKKIIVKSLLKNIPGMDPELGKSLACSRNYQRLELTVQMWATS